MLALPKQLDYNITKLFSSSNIKWLDLFYFLMTVFYRSLRTWLMFVKKNYVTTVYGRSFDSNKTAKTSQCWK